MFALDIGAAMRLCLIPEMANNVAGLGRFASIREFK
jgi:hypothetical protein